MAEARDDLRFRQRWRLGFPTKRLLGPVSNKKKHQFLIKRGNSDSLKDNRNFEGQQNLKGSPRQVVYCPLISFKADAEEKCFAQFGSLSATEVFCFCFISLLFCLRHSLTTWFLLTCNDMVNFSGIFSKEFLNSMMKSSAFFFVSLFFFSDDRFISKYLLSSPTTPEPSSCLP